MVKILLFGLIIASFVVFFSMALAQESSPATPSPSPVDYALPYPGLLPDHPLFFLKVLRDKILTLFISNNLRRVEFYQLMSDKYLNMGVFLSEKNKWDVAISTLKKSVSYIGETKKLLDNLPATKSDEIGNIKLRFERSLGKYEQVLLKLVETCPEDKKATINELLAKITELKSQVK